MHTLLIEARCPACGETGLHEEPFDSLDAASVRRLSRLLGTGAPSACCEADASIVDVVQVDLAGGSPVTVVSEAVYDAGGSPIGDAALAALLEDAQTLVRAA